MRQFLSSRVKHPSPELPSETSSILRSYLQSHGMSSTQRPTDDAFDCLDPLLGVRADSVCSSLKTMRRGGGSKCMDAILGEEKEEDGNSISR